MRTSSRALLSVALLALLASGTASAQSATVPLCTSFNAAGQPVGFVGTTPTTSCTDLFAVSNWANSPLPAGSITGFTLVASGSGYVNPVVVVNDPTGTGATATATVDASGSITGVTGSSPSGYILPQVTIIDVGAGGTLAAPTCGGAGTPCGSGAIATAILGGPYTGGMKKFQDAFKDLPLAVADTSTFPGADYYEIGLVQYSQVLHSSLPPTTLRGYVQLKSGSTGCSAANQLSAPAYLGPTIVATKGRPVRVKFTNCLPTGAQGDLFIPVDTTYMGAGASATAATYTANRATLHLHGGLPPWISDGTPHQWTAPVGETTPLQRGASVGLVPDMWFDATGAVIPSCSGQTSCGVAGATNDPGQGALTFFWTNQQGGRLMFYHDHAYGLTRLNVYAGEAAGYLLVDPKEEDALAAAGAPGTLGTAADAAHMIPLVIQDKSFVPSAAQIAAQDPTWSAYFGTTPGTAHAGDLWFPHVYTTNQNPADPGGANGFGRWDYGPWFIAPQTVLTAANPPTAVTTACTSSAFPGSILQSTAACPTCGCPIIPNPSGTPEGFMDTPVVNGVAYPTLTVDPTAYRLQILAAGNDRSFNLSWFVADSTGTEVAMLPASPPPASGATVPLCSQINSVTNPGLVMGLPKAILDASGNPINGTGLPSGCWPNYGPQFGIPAPQTMWAADGRAGGSPDPRNAGPAWVQIGTEGGLLASPVVIPPTPVNYEQNTRSVTITNVAVHGLWLGPAERADTIVDFSQFAGKTLILYNDAPTPAPAFDSRLDYFTNDGDQSPIGGAPNTPPGYGPNTRTIMQVVVRSTGATPPFSVAALKAAFKPNATTQATFGTASPVSLFAATQPTPVVPEAGYNAAYGTSQGNTYGALQANTMVFQPLANVLDPTQSLSMPSPVGIPDSCPAPGTLAPGQQCVDLGRKAIQELFTTDYGRMNATLGTELPLTNFTTQTTIPLGYTDPPTEIIRLGDTQLWKITHNGVDTHFIHFHLFNVQVINRVGWDGSIRAPDENEIGWKDTVRMNPLEDIIVAVQPMVPSLPWPLPNSVRFEDVTAPLNTSAQFTNLDPFTNVAATTLNGFTNYGWEYVWHCHILGHEENDMMRPIVFLVPPPAPSNLLAAAAAGGGVQLSWKDNSASETGFTVQRDTDPGFPAPSVINAPPSTPTNVAGEGTSWGGTITIPDPIPLAQGTTYYYRVRAIDDAFGAPFSQSYNAMPALLSGWSNVATVVPVPIAGISPTALGFGSVLVGTLAGPQGLTLSNTGTAALVINGIGLTGANAGDFALPASAQPCGASLGAGATCTIAVTFTPTAVGGRAAAVTISTNDPAHGTITVTLTGTGIAATSIALIAPTITYGSNGAVSVAVTSPQITPVTGTVTLSVDGGAPVGLTLVGGSATFTSANVPALLAPAVGTHTLNAAFAAQGGLAASSGTGTLTVNPVTLTITASSGAMTYGGSVPVITPTYGAFVLGQGAANLTGTVTCSTTATSASPVGTYPSSCSGATSTNYSITYVPGTVTVGQATSSTTISSNVPNPAILGQVVTVGFKVAPQFTGTPTGSVKVTASTGETCTGSLTGGTGSCTLTFFTAGARTLTAAYGGDANFTGSTSAAASQAVSSVSLSTGSLLFGDQVVTTTSARQTVTLSNVGTAPLSIASIGLAGANAADFAVTGNCPIGGTLLAGRSCSINVTFTPGATGVRTATVSITDSDATSPQTVALTGTGILPSYSVTPSPIAFGKVSVRTTATQTVTITNGNVPLAIRGISVGGLNASNFTLTNNTCPVQPATLGPSQRCSVSVSFRPTSVGNKAATLNVRVLAPATSTAIAITGAGQ